MNKMDFGNLKRKILLGTTVAVSTMAGLTSCSEEASSIPKYKDNMEIVLSPKAKSLKSYNEKETRALFSAIRDRNYAEVIRTIENGANVNAQIKETGQTPLMLLIEQFENYYSDDALKEHYIEKVKAVHKLLDCKDIDLSIEDNLRCSALDYARFAAEGSGFNSSNRFHYSVLRRIEEKLADQNKDSRTYHLSPRIAEQRDL